MFTVSSKRGPTVKKGEKTSSGKAFDGRKNGSEREHLRMKVIVSADVLEGRDYHLRDEERNGLG